MVKDYLVSKRENSIILRYSSYIIKKIKYYFALKKLNNEENERSRGKLDKRYDRLRNFRNKYAGESCFIVATGPSLSLEDLALIKGKYSFGVNSICKLLNNTDWKPDFYAIQDSFVYEKLENEIKKLDMNVFVGGNLSSQFLLPANYIQFPLNHLYHQAELDIDRFFSWFSSDSYSVVYDGYSITYSAIQLAIYFGFNKIYLLGCDCNYPKGEKNHVVESGFVDKYAFKNHDKMITGYQAAKEYADAHDVKIINCTRGGMLEIYPRMNLEDVLEEK